MDTEKMVSPVEAYQEAKKINRFLKSFSEFESVLKVLAEYDVIVQGLEAKATVLDNEINQKKLVLSDLEVECKKADESVVATKAKADKIRQETEEFALKLKADTEAKLEQMKIQAKNEVQRLREDLSRFRPVVQQLQTEKLQLEGAIAELKKQASAQAESLAGALKALS